MMQLTELKSVYCCGNEDMCYLTSSLEAFQSGLQAGRLLGDKPLQTCCDLTLTLCQGGLKSPSLHRPLAWGVSAVFASHGFYLLRERFALFGNRNVTRFFGHASGTRFFGHASRFLALHEVKGTSTAAYLSDLCKRESTVHQPRLQDNPASQ